MSNPIQSIQSILSGAEHFVSPITNIFSRMFTIPGIGGGGGPPNVNIPAQSQLIPAQQPAGQRPVARGMQQSFISGLAQSGLPGQSSSSQTGKTLLGA